MLIYFLLRTFIWNAEYLLFILFPWVFIVMVLLSYTSCATKKCLPKLWHCSFHVVHFWQSKSWWNC